MRMALFRCGCIISWLCLQIIHLPLNGTTASLELWQLHDCPWRNAEKPSQWRHKEHDGVSNHQPHFLLLNHLFKRRSRSASLAFVRGIHRWQVNSPPKGPALGGGGGGGGGVWGGGGGVGVGGWGWGRLGWYCKLRPYQIALKEHIWKHISEQHFGNNTPWKVFVRPWHIM